MRFLLKVFGISLLGVNVALAGIAMDSANFKEVKKSAVYGIPTAKVKSLKDWDKLDETEIQRAASIQQTAPQRQVIQQQAPQQQIVQQQAPQQQAAQQQQDQQEENPLASFFKGLAGEVAKGAINQALSR